MTGVSRLPVPEYTAAKRDLDTTFEHLRELRLRKKTTANGKEKLVLPQANWMLSKTELGLVSSRITSIKMPRPTKKFGAHLEIHHT